MAINNCDGCSECCKYVSLEIDKPTTKKDFDNIIWYVLHKKVKVFIDLEKDWFIEFSTSCKELNSKGLCNFYKKRPKICKSYSPSNCERTGNCYYKVFSSRKDVENYMREIRIV